MTSSKVKLITRTAILLALTVIFQALGRYIPLGPNSNFVVGPLVNACLIIAAAEVGLTGATVIAIAAPFGTLITGGTLPLPFLPVVALGNLLLVLLVYLIRKNYFAGIVTGALIKCGFLFAGVTIFLNMIKAPAKLSKAMTFMFSWPQFVTAIIGGIIALVVIKALEKSNANVKYY